MSYKASTRSSLKTSILRYSTTSLKCSTPRDPEVGNFLTLKQGITNLSCHFSVGDEEYVYRYPGVGTDKMINRGAEQAALELASDLGLDSTFMHMDAKRGWKIYDLSLRHETSMYQTRRSSQTQ